MHTDTDGIDAADVSTATASSITYCQVVLWIKPLLAVIEKGNNNLMGIRQIELERKNEDGSSLSARVFLNDDFT